MEKGQLDDDHFVSGQKLSRPLDGGGTEHLGLAGRFHRQESGLDPVDGGSGQNLMNREQVENFLSDVSLTADQIEEMQQKLSRAIARGGDRHE
jgi:hypothetical protein